MLSPLDVVARVVLHLPFLTGFASLRTQSPPAVAPLRPLTFDVADPGEDSDLILQRYSDELRADFAEHLPHRVLTIAIPSVHPVRTFTGLVVEGSSIRWDARSIDVDVWNLGVGLVSATYRLEPPALSNWPALGAEVEESRHVLKDSFQSLREAAIAQTREAVVAGKLSAWQFPDHGARKPDGQALWTHVTFLLEANAEVGAEELDAIAERLTWGGTAVRRSEELKDVVVRIGLDSCVAYRRNDAITAAAVARKVGVHSVVWAATVDFDRRLLGLRRQDATSSLRELEEQMERAVAAYEHVRSVRVEIETAGVHLSSLDQALWASYADTWNLKHAT